MGRLSLSYRTKFWLLAGLAFGTALLLGVVIGKTVPSTSGVEDPALMLALFFAITLAVGFVNWLWWKRTDELQQQGQLVSWWWGGNLGAVLMLICLVTLTGRHSDLSLGAQYLLLAEFAGFAVVWLVWKFRGRGPAE